MTPETIQQIVLIATPLVVFGVTWIVNKLTGLQGFPILLAMTLINIAVMLVATWVIPESGAWWLHLVAGFVAVFVNELKKQLTPR